ncbi:hypothetical protein ACXO2A_09070, partial [Lactobacillus delbrueckii subsp. bulgaricus]
YSSKCYKRNVLRTLVIKGRNFFIAFFFNSLAKSWISKKERETGYCFTASRVRSYFFIWPVARENEGR